MAVDFVDPTATVPNVTEALGMHERKVKKKLILLFWCVRDGDGLKGANHKLMYVDNDMRKVITFLKL